MKFSVLTLGLLALAALPLSALAEQTTATNPNPFLATPVPPAEGEAAAATEEAPLPAPEGSEQLASPTPATSTVTTTAAPPEPESVAPSQPLEQAPISVSSLPGKTQESPATDPNSMSPNKNIYQEFDEYLEAAHAKEGSERDVRQRNLFPHEDGAWQVALDYTRFAFSDYNFNFNESGTLDSKGQPRRVYADTQGGTISVSYFPIRTLRGRLGFSGIAGIYWSKFEVETPSVDSTSTVIGNTLTATSRHSVDTYGIRATYEATFYLGQILVPFFYLGYDRVKIQGYKVGVSNIQVLDIPARSIGSASYGLGAHFNLNRVEPVVASRALVNVGVRKFYLSYTMNQRMADLSGLSHYLGLRFEF